MSTCIPGSKIYIPQSERCQRNLLSQCTAECPPPLLIVVSPIHFQWNLFVVSPLHSDWKAFPAEPTKIHATVPAKPAKKVIAFQALGIRFLVSPAAKQRQSAITRQLTTPNCNSVRSAQVIAIDACVPKLCVYS